MDAFGDLLRTVHVDGAAFVDATFTEPWCWISVRARTAPALPGCRADRLVPLALVTEGECWIEVPGVPPRRVTCGQALLLPHGHAYRMTSDLTRRSTAGIRLHHILARRPRRVTLGGDGPRTQVILGYLAFDSRLVRRLFDGLPPLVCVDANSSGPRRWLEATMRYALEQTHTPGGDALPGRLAELLLAEIVRLYAVSRSHDPASRAWAMAMRDRAVGAALTAIHRDVARNWTIADLARVGGTSRSVLAERFQSLVGTSPIQYLTHWRMVRAAHLMSTTDAPLVRIAEDVGYQTDTAFNRAFRREFGMPPAKWRRQRDAPQSRETIARAERARPNGSDAMAKGGDARAGLAIGC